MKRLMSLVACCAVLLSLSFATGAFAAEEKAAPAEKAAEMPAEKAAEKPAEKPAEMPAEKK